MDNKLVSIDRIVEDVWTVYQNSETGFYPVFESKIDLQKTYEMAKNDDVLLSYNDGNSWAYLPLIVDESSSYLQANGGIASNNCFEAASDHFISLMKEHYKGYKFISAYPSSNQKALGYLKSNNYQCVEHLYQYTFDLKELIPGSISGYRLLNPEVDLSFSKHHSDIFPEMYWNSKRILDDLDNWTVLVNNQEMINESIGARHYFKEGKHWAEVYFNYGSALNLLNTLLIELQQKTTEFVLFFVDANDKEMLEVVSDLGFNFIKDYNCFEIEL